MSPRMLKADGRPDQFVLDGLDCPQFYNQQERATRRRNLLVRFADAAKTETAFYLAFNTLAVNDVAFLMSDLGIESDWALFRKLCRTHNVKVA